MLKTGQTADLKKTFGPDEVRLFAQLSEDFNPLHLDETFASETPFGRPIVHGLLLSSLFSGLLGQKLPGEGSVYLGQTLSFKKPIFVGEEVTAQVEVTQIREDKPIATLATRIFDCHGDLAVDGEAVVKFPTSWLK